MIAPQPFLQGRGTPLSVYYRALAATECGVEIDLLTYGEGEDVDLPNLRIIRIPRLSFLGHVRVGPSWLKAFLDLLVGLWAVALLVRNRYNFVHAHEEAVFLCLVLKSLFRFKLVYDMHSSLPKQLMNFQFTRSRLLIGAFRRLERASLQAADLVITVSPDLARQVLAEIGDPNKHFLIENSLVDPVRRPGACEQHRPAAAPTAGRTVSEKPLIVYAGTLEAYQGIDLLLGAFADTLQRVPLASLLLVGGAPEQVAHYSALARALGVDGSCSFTGSVSPEVANKHSARADVLVSPRTGGTQIPLKLYAQLASGIPLVATDVEAHTQVLDGRMAFLCEPTRAGLARALLEALTDHAERARKVEAARGLHERTYCRRIYISKMRQMLSQLR